MRYFDQATLDRMFYPKTMAVVGAKQASNYNWLVRNQVFQGKLYSVQIDEREIPGIEALGIPNFRVLKDVPEPIDYVIFAVPRKVSPEVFGQCIDAKVGGVSLYTSGFAETDQEGIELQERLSRMSIDSGVPLIGPNAMGVYNPALGVRQGNEQSYGELGEVGFLGASGTHSSYYASTVHALYGIKLALGVSFGNAAVLDAADWMEYIGGKSEVKVLTAYIEGIGDTRRFSEALSQVASRKPVLVWKGGRTEDGFRASFSHTGSQSVPAEEWETIVREAGAIRTDDLETMADTTAALLKLPGIKGPRGGLICMTGGQSVVITDAFCAAGLQVPTLSEKSYAELSTFFDVIGGSHRNPLDVGWMSGKPELVQRELAILDEDENTDFVTMELFAPNMPLRRAEGTRSHLQVDDPDREESQESNYLEVLAQQQKLGKKPFFAMVTSANAERDALDLRQALAERGVLAFPSAQRAATAYRKALDYRQRT